MSTATTRPGTAAQRDALSIYLNDHLAAATGGFELARRAADSEQGSVLGAPLQSLADEVAADRDALRVLMAQLDVGVAGDKVAAGWLARAGHPVVHTGGALGAAPA